MRLLNVETFQLEEFLYVAHPPYTILSHTWGKDGEEVSFRDVVNGRLKTPETRPIKLSGCCKQVNDDGYKYVWIDTCCIDNSNSVELQEAINSMFRWYQEAQICYAFLSDVSAGDDPHDPQSKFFSSKWFRRGWTLQELLAPLNVRIYDSDWRCLGTKGDLCDVIEKITGIPTQFLLGITELHHASVAQRMSWAAGRATKREEDIAYCLLGIFSVNMPMIYGEGDKAFRRLQEQIMKDIGDDSILAWGLDLRGLASDSLSASISGRILAATPSDFANCGQIALRERPTSNVFDIHGGNLRLQLFLITTSAGETLGLLTCGPEDDPEKVVGIPLATASRESSGEYMRSEGRHAVLFSKPATQASTSLIQIPINGKVKPATTPSQPFWFRIQKTFSSIELVDVEPHSRWHRERGLIEAGADPDSNSMQRTLTRFRYKAGRSLDFMVMLEVDAQSSESQARCHVMIASRRTSLQDVTRKFSDMRPEALRKQSASNGILNLHVTLEYMATQRVFIIRLDTLSSSPAVSANATSELQYLNLVEELKHIKRKEEVYFHETKERRHLLADQCYMVNQTETRLKVVREELDKLREEETSLAKRLVYETEAVLELEREKNRVMFNGRVISRHRSDTERRLNEFWNTTTSTDTSQAIAALRYESCEQYPEGTPR